MIDVLQSVSIIALAITLLIQNKVMDRTLRLVDENTNHITGIIKHFRSFIKIYEKDLNMHHGIEFEDLEESNNGSKELK